MLVYRCRSGSRATLAGLHRPSPAPWVACNASSGCNVEMVYITASQLPNVHIFGTDDISFPGDELETRARGLEAQRGTGRHLWTNMNTLRCSPPVAYALAFKCKVHYWDAGEIADRSECVAFRELLPDLRPSHLKASFEVATISSDLICEAFALLSPETSHFELTINFEYWEDPYEDLGLEPLLVSTYH